MNLLELLLSPVLAQGAKLESILMGIKEDFAAFKTAVDEALAEIVADLEALKALAEGGTVTPAEVTQGMADILAKLGTTRNIYNPAAPPPPEEPL